MLVRCCNVVVSTACFVFVASPWFFFRKHQAHFYSLLKRYGFNLVIRQSMIYIYIYMLTSLVAVGTWVHSPGMPPLVAFGTFVRSPAAVL